MPREDYQTKRKIDSALKKDRERQTLIKQLNRIKFRISKLDDQIDAIKNATWPDNGRLKNVHRHYSLNLDFSGYEP